MRAVIAHAARDLRIETVPVPDLGPKDVRIRMKAGGICGSDLHYYLHGGFGTVRLREPMVLGHEISGTVEAVGAEVSRVSAGDLVAINPSRPCNQCVYCHEGQRNQCLDMRFFGSAMRFPHVQGGFRQVLVCDEGQAFPVGSSVSAGEAAMAEPLAVCLHATRQAGSLLGKKVLVTGAGPIGALSVLSARRAGAIEIVVTDINDAPLGTVAKIGADRVINTAKNSEALSVFEKDKGYFDVLLEASGSGAALAGALPVVRPGATIVQIGLGGDVPVSINTLVAKEVTLRGSFRFDAEFGMAVGLIGKGLIDVKPLISDEFSFTDATKAFDVAADRSRSMKVQLSFA